MKGRSLWVDYAKAIGIVLVVYGHVARGLQTAGITMPERLYQLTDSIIYTFHMPLFFFLSGLFFYDSFARRGGLGLTFNKIDTIFYPYVLWSILQGVIEALLADYTNASVSYGEVFALLWQPRAHFWFLYALFFCFLVATIFFSLLSRKWAGMVFILAVVVYCFPWLLPKGQLSIYIAQNLVYFMLGVMFSFHGDAARLANLRSLLLLGLAFVLGQLVFHLYFNLQYSDRGVAALLLAVASIFFVVSLSALGALRPHRAILYIGSASMAIYLMHILAGSGIRVVLSKLMGVDSLLLHLSLGCLAGVGLPVLAYWLIQRWRLTYLLSTPISKLFLPRRELASTPPPSGGIK